jgi:hypothetical protein
MDSVFRTEVKRVWRDVIGYEGIYKVSNLGEVYSVRSKGLLECVRGKYVNLSRDGRAERLKVAYLVARLFIRNEELRPYVIHLNGDRSDNRASNLAWSEVSEEDSRGRREQKCSRAVLCYSEDGEFVGRYVSIGDAAIKVGVSKQGILRVCQGKGRRCGGYIWRYE